MTSARPRSGAARFGLLVVALVHLLATAALPLTHTHALAGAADRVIAAGGDGDDRSAPGHPDFCTICSTLTHVRMAPDLAVAVSAAADVLAIAGTSPRSVISSRVFAAAQPRAPPSV
jgi:hypothetical protein